MDIELVRKVLAWCTVFNMALLLVWVGFVAFAGDWVYRRHTQFVKISREAFDTVHYAGMAFFKIVIFVFNLVPYLVLQMMV
jgi:hypothetical protein